MRTVRALLLLLAMASSLVVSIPPAQGAAVPASTNFTDIDAYVQREAANSRIPGIALAIVRGDRVVHFKGFGQADESGRPVTARTSFVLGSVSKSFTALAVMQLVDSGRIELDTPIQHYIRWFRVADPAAMSRMTVRQFLNQTSGLPPDAGANIYSGPAARTIQEEVRTLRTAELDRPVGSSFEYTDINYVVLGALIEVVSHESYGTYLQRHIFEPLEMRHSFTNKAEATAHGMATGYRFWFGFPIAYDAPYFLDNLPAGFVISSAQDLGHYLSMYLSHGKYGGRTIVSEAAIHEMQRPPRGSHYGMGWNLGTYGGVPAVYHDGNEANFFAALALVPRGNWGIVVLQNIHGAMGGIGQGVISESVTGMVVGGQKAESTHIGLYSFLFDTAVGTVLAIQVWSLARLLRRRNHLQLPWRGVRHILGELRRWALPLAWELGLPVTVLAGFPALTGASWQALFLFFPDAVCALFAVFGVWLITGIARIVILTDLLPRRPSTARIAPISSEHPMDAGYPTA